MIAAIQLLKTKLQDKKVFPDVRSEIAEYIKKNEATIEKETPIIKAIKNQKHINRRSTSKTLWISESLVPVPIYEAVARQADDVLYPHVQAKMENHPFTPAPAQPGSPIAV